MGTNPQTHPKPNTKARKSKSKPEIVLSTPKKDVAILEPETGSKRKRECFEERKSKKQKVSPSIAKKIIFFDGNCNTHNNRLGTAQHALVGCNDLAGQSSNLTAGMAAWEEIGSYW